MKKIISFITVILIIGSRTLSFSTDIALYKAKVQFATIEKATVLLSTPDEYLNNLSPFDLDAMMHKHNATKEEQLKNTLSQIKAWTPEEKKRLSSILDMIDKNITDNGFKINFPKEIYLIKSTMKDISGADGYTRGNSIILGEDEIKKPDAQLKQLLTHELFHVLTRHDSLFKKEMYTIIGFNIMNEINYPPSLQKFKMSNPDAPKTDSYITLKKDGEDVECAMILYSEKEYSTGNFFDYITLGFLRVQGADKKEIVYIDDKPVVYSFKEISNFIEQVGKNTEYIIDPEEIMADNFAFAIDNKKGLPSQEITNKIQEELKK